MSDAKTVIIIPARMASGRLPGKPLRMIAGKPLLQWTYERARCAEADNVLVVSPDREIYRFCKESGIPWWPSSDDLPDGTHRCAAALEQMDTRVNVTRVVNWQVDEPLVPIEAVRHLLNSNDPVSTIVAGMDCCDKSYVDHNTVKVAVGDNGCCYWFTRAPIAGDTVHCGVYSFQPSVLKMIGRKDPTALAQRENLEQLTWIEARIKTTAVFVPRLPPAVNCESDLAVVEKTLREMI